MPESYRVRGTHEMRFEPKLRFCVQPFQLTEDDKQKMQTDPSHIPTPKLHRNTSTHFDLTTTTKIL